MLFQRKNNAEKNSPLSLNGPNDFLEHRDQRRVSILSPMVLLPYLAAIVLSLISFHTTYYGMRSFYGLGSTSDPSASRIADPLANTVNHFLKIDIENLFALCFAAVVQAGILLTSAYLFRLLFKARSTPRQVASGSQSIRLTYFVSLVLIFLLPISILFSYGARLEWQIGPEQKSVIQAGGAHSDATDMMNSLKVLMSEEERRRSDLVTDLPAFKSWMTGMEELTKAASRAPEAIRDYLKNIESAELEKREAARRQQAEADQQTLEFDRQADLVNASIKIIDERIKKLLPLADASPPSTAEFDNLIQRHETEMKKEQSGIGACGPAGEGTCFNRHKAERDKVARERDLFLQRASAASRAAADEIRRLKKDKIQKEAELENIADRAKLAGRVIVVDPSINSLDPAAQLPMKIRELQSTIGKHGTKLQAALTDLRGGFTSEKYTLVTEQCRSLLPITMIGDPATNLRGLDCTPAALAPEVSSVQEFHERRSQFDQKCGSLPAYAAESPEGYANQVFEKVNSCIELSGLGVQELFRQRIANISDRLAKAISNRSSGVDYLTFTTGELRDGKRIAFLALFFAIAVDVLVLVFTFLGELPRLNTNIAPSVRALSGEERKGLVADLQAVNDALDSSDLSRFRLARALVGSLQLEAAEGIVRLNLGRVSDVAERQAIDRRLLPLLGSGLAWSVRAEKDAIYLTERALNLLIQECRRIIAREEAALHSTGVMPSPVPADQLGLADPDGRIRGRRIEQDRLTTSGPLLNPGSPWS